VGQDRAKTTFVTFAGLEGARQLARELVETSERALAPFGPRAQPLRDLAWYVLHRKK
jgi:farnesyl diphosphate synthase